MLTDRALLVKLRISDWNAYKRDRNVTKEVEERHHAEQAGAFNKCLIPHAQLKPIRDVLRTMRSEHINTTLPWDEEGYRLLKITAFPAYQQRMMELQGQLEKTVAEFQQRYPEHIEQRALKLGSMFDRDAYPEVNEIPDLFHASLHFTRVPDDNADFRTTLDESERKVIHDKIKSEFADRQSRALQSITDRITETLNTLYEKMTVEDGRVYESYFNAVSNLVEVVPTLNIYDDPTITELVTEIKTRLGAYKADDVRKNDALKGKVAREAHDILNKMNDYFAHAA